MRGRLPILAVGGLVYTLAGAPQPPHGPYANREGYRCHRGATVERQKLVHCGCKLQCDATGAAYEDNGCQTYCDTNKNDPRKKQCLCHLDEACEPGMERAS